MSLRTDQQVARSPWLVSREPVPVAGANCRVIPGHQRFEPPTPSHEAQPMSAAVRLATQLIRVYQLLISPLLGTHCRFAPTCSQYAREALQRHGLGRGSLLTLRRLSRCHPFHPGGWDPVA